MGRKQDQQPVLRRDIEIGAAEILVAEVQVDAATVFSGGVATDLKVGMKIEAEGQILGGVLLADKVSFKENIRIEVAAAGANGATLTVQLRRLPALHASSKYILLPVIQWVPFSDLYKNKLVAPNTLVLHQHSSGITPTSFILLRNMDSEGFPCCR